MTRAIPILVVLLSLPAMAARTSEVLVDSADKTTLPALNNRSGLEIFNYGPNPLHCSFGTEITGNAYWVIAANDATDPLRPIPGYWTSAAKYYQTITCLAATADQISGAATIVNELD